MHGALRASACADVVLEECASSPSNETDLQEPRRDDAVGVDVVAAQRQRRPGDS